MNHTEKRIWLIKELQKDPSQLSEYQIPTDEQGQKDLLTEGILLLKSNIILCGADVETGCDYRWQMRMEHGS